MIIARKALRHKRGKRHMHDQERHDRGHGGEVHVTRGVVATKKAGEAWNCTGFQIERPDSHDHDAGQQNAEIEKLLYRVVN